MADKSRAMNDDNKKITCKKSVWWDINLKKKFVFVQVRNLEDPNDSRCGAHLKWFTEASLLLDETLQKAMY